MFDVRSLADYLESRPSECFPYRLLTETEGVAYRYDLGDVLAVVASQLIEGRVVVVMPPDKPPVM